MKDKFQPGSTHKITVFIHKPRVECLGFMLHTGDLTERGYPLIGTQEILFTIPEGFNPVAAELAMLNKELETLNDQHMQRVAQIKGRINDLLALSYEPKTEVIDGHEIQLSDQ
jgi:hypothetical protein